MIIQEMVYLFKLQAERVDTKKSQDLSIPKIITILNSGQINLIKRKYGINNLYRSGFEAVQKRKQDLQKLSVLNEEISPTVSGSTVVQFDLSNLAKPFLFDTRVRFKASKGTCTNKILVGLPTQTDDMNLVDMSSNRIPSFEWRETTYRIASDRIHAESDGSFTIPKMVIDYLRYPVNMDIVGYKHFSGATSTNINCELPEFLIGEVIDQAALEFKLWTQDPNFQFSQVKQTVNE
jgi:hypothetical protein